MHAVVVNSSRSRISWFAGLGSLLLLLYLYAGNLQLHTTGSNFMSSASPHHAQASVIDLYLRTLAASLSGYALQTSAVEMGEGSNPELPFNDHARRYGLDWPRFGYTMIGMHRLDNLRYALEEVMGVTKNGGSTAIVAGDYLECGVWRGGASIFATGVLSAWSDPSREVHLCDSFSGLPQASTAADDDKWSKMKYLEVSLETVRSHFQRFYLLQDRVKFHRGYFQFSLPLVREELMRRQRQLAVLRLDGDMYESTMDELFNLYGLLSVGGFVIIDDWAVIPECRTAIREFIKMHDMVTDIVVDKDVAYWRKTADVDVNYDWYVNWNLTRNSVATTNR